MRPSTRWTLPTPAWIASTQLSSFGNMPPPTIPVSFSLRTLPIRSVASRDAGSFTSISSPGTSETNASLRTFMALAKAAAAVSALTLYTLPSGPVPSGVTTGTMPASSISATGRMSTDTGSPTNPQSSAAPLTGSVPVFFATPKIQSPCSGRAFAKCFCSSRTTLAFTSSLITRSTTRTASSVVTRKPCTKCGAMPAASMPREIALPPPCTSTVFMPTAFINAMSVSSPSRFSSTSMTLPPTLTSTTDPLKS